MTVKPGSRPRNSGALAIVRQYETELRKIHSTDSARADRKRADAFRQVLRSYADLVCGSPDEGKVSQDMKKLRKLAGKAMLHLGGNGDPQSTSLRDYDHRRFGPYLGVSDEGSACSVIRRAALDSPKARAVRKPWPMMVGVAHDAERLGAIGEVPVGPLEYSNIWLDSVGRILTSTNVGTRLNIRFYKRHPVVVVQSGEKRGAIAAAKEAIRGYFTPFLATPDGTPRALMVYVRFDPESRRTFQDRVSILRILKRYVESGEHCDPAVHRLGLLLNIGYGAKGMRASLLGVNLARAAGLSDLGIDGVPRKDAEELVSLPGLLNFMTAEHLTPVLKRAANSEIHVRPKNTVDPDTIARTVWASLVTARHMGLDLGKYGTLPLTLQESDQVIGQVQKWFPDWTAAPVFFVDQGIVSNDRVFVGTSLVAGLRKWLRMVAKHKVPVVLIDTADKGLGWKLLKDPAEAKGVLTSTQIRAVDTFAQKLGVNVLWAGGISLRQCYDFGKLGVFGIYVTSAAASSVAVTDEYKDDPLLAALKEPSYEGVYRAKLLLEAGFLSVRLAGEARGEKIRKYATEMIEALEKNSADQPRIERRLAAEAMRAWKTLL